ncbi:MAG TPA: Rieske (2Fe-2S) protein [Pseudoduganella sp.]|jgi:nitrite reductase/ring-hydroxylating ferredoxin subunit
MTDRPAAAPPATDRWHPVLPSSHLPATALQPPSSPVLGFLGGEELALWRASDGTAQAWTNRCPHRGLRFTLGRVLDGRLSCGYHGWEYQAGDGRCVAIPAHPAMTVPRAICATTWPTAEVDGMIWVSRTACADAPPATGIQAILRTLGIRAPHPVVADMLPGLGWVHSAAGVFTGKLAGHGAVLLPACAGERLTLLHAGLTDAADPARLPGLHAALRSLRDALETAAPHEEARQ